MEDSRVEVECPECGEILFSENKLELLKMSREVSEAFRGKTHNEVVEEVRASDKDINLSGFDVTPSVNTLGKYEIDASPRYYSPVTLVFNTECYCGNLYNLEMKTDYSRPPSVDFEVSPADSSK